MRKIILVLIIAVTCIGSISQAFASSPNRNECLKEKKAKRTLCLQKQRQEKILKTLKAKVIEFTNIERAKIGIHPLRYNAFLEKAAQAYSEELRDKDYMEHTSPEGVTLEERILDAGYLDAYLRCDCGRSYSLGENIAKGQKTPEMVMKDWMNSPTHRDNLLKIDYDEIGIGMTQINKKTKEGYDPKAFMWVQNFGVVPEYETTEQ